MLRCCHILLRSTSRGKVTMTTFLGIEPSDLEEVDVLMAIAVASTIPTKLEACACYVGKA